MEDRKKSKNLLQWEQEEKPLDDGELHFEKPTNEIVNQILKYNPIDPLNVLYRRFIELLNFKEQEKELQWWGANIYVHAATRFIWRIDVQNVEGHIFPQYGNNAGKGGILISNHESHFDPFFVGSATENIRIQWMSKRDNFRTPLVKTLFTNLGAYEHNKENLQETWDKSKEILESGQWIGIFPEATRNIDGTIGQFKTGAVRLAIECGVPIVPAAVIGSRKVLPKGSLWVTPAKVTVRIGKPIYYIHYDPDEITYELIRKLSDELRQEVLDLLEGKHEYAYSVTEFKKKSKKYQGLSIGSPSDTEDRTEGFKQLAKHYMKSYLQLIDDTWMSLIKAAEVFGIRRQFELLCWQFNGNFIQRVMCDTFMPYKRIDYDKYLPKESAAVVCSNHNSEWDVIINAVACQQEGRRLYQMAKESLFQMPIVNAWIRTHLAFPLMRGESDEGSYWFARERLKEGELVMVYPEGTTVGGPEVLEGHTGAVRLAIEAKVPIIPIGITGTEDTFPKHAKMLNFGKSSVFKMGKPFTDHYQYFEKGVPDYDELKRLTDDLMERIKDLLVYDDTKI
ncbi:MAG: lysophospholipid acyltransferase family protein [Promethearchaeota archaeon]